MSSGSRITAAGSLVLVVSLTGCASIRLESVAREDPAHSAGYVELGPAEAAGAVQVVRRGRSLAPRPSMALEPGDELETGRDGVAVITFAKHGTIVLAPSTRVRIGSLEVLFGRIFASVRGLFSAESDDVVAGVEGTEFALELGPDRTVRVVLVDGVVTCRSKQGSWPEVRIGAGQAFFSSYPHRASPTVELASPSELAELRDWARRVRDAPRAGYCCDGGRVFRSLATECRGVFRETAEQARAACTSGWCCATGGVTQASEAQCRSSEGRFFRDRESAQRACAITSQGWCCASGRVFETSQDRCRSARGQLFPDASSAERACAEQEKGWCCYLPQREGRGEVRYESRSQCRGAFFTDETTARRQCVRID